ncbi:D-alanyl-lipoteichoic acid biosynthesis protein DltB [Clostridium oryzae]|uniref:Teichoic acid D-alanyltransferase n=1 Tax=Clostridium oryzae TaxID=1450648 RepID=A0A1V4IZR4_9CLOT|nr:D-alanyl-lipoteichoic acid biosynthesis protein DltB [Clostridium oryzae]OPJ65255.1 peptidoglycan O-acetyltransferase [Clostridium oryzae]
MTFFGGHLFYLCLVLLLIPAVILGILQKSLRLYTLAISILFIYLIFGKDHRQLAYLFTFYVLQLILVKLYLILRKRYGRKENIYYCTVFLSVVPLIFDKINPLIHTNIFQFLGVSYLTFKSVQMIIEIYDGIITEVPIVEFSAFLLHFPSLSSGPIDRSRRFHEDWVKIYSREEYLNLFANGVFKILLGLIYKFIIAAGFYKLMGICADFKAWYYVVGYTYAYGLDLFFDFAGYSLMAVGTSYILGVRTPDNFNKPFLSLDMREFWDRWHISLSYWFRDFIFSRFIIKCVKKKWFKNRLHRASIGFIINMLVMGMWHGLNASYILYGLYHGCLLALTESYQKKSKFYKENKDKKSYKFLSWFITMQLVMFGFLIFSGKFIKLLHLAKIVH